MPEPKRTGHFRMFTAISTTMPGRSTGQHRECPNFPQMRRLPWALIRSNLAYRFVPPPSIVWRSTPEESPVRYSRCVLAHVLHHEERRHSAAGSYCENTAVDVDLRTCDVGRLIGSQEQDGVRHLVNFPWPAHWNEAHSFGPESVRGAATTANRRSGAPKASDRYGSRPHR